MDAATGAAHNALRIPAPSGPYTDFRTVRTAHVSSRLIQQPQQPQQSQWSLIVGSPAVRRALCLGCALQVCVGSESAAHSKRSDAACDSQMCSSVSDMPWIILVVVCGPCPKQNAKLAETTPTAHFDQRAFCCVDPSLYSSLRGSTL